MGGRLRAVRRAAEIVDTLHKAFVKASQAPDMQDKFHKGGMVAPQQASVDDAKVAADEMASWRRDLAGSEHRHRRVSWV